MTYEEEKRIINKRNQLNEVLCADQDEVDIRILRDCKRHTIELGIGWASLGAVNIDQAEAFAKKILEAVELVRKQGK